MPITPEQAAEIIALNPQYPQYYEAIINNELPQYYADRLSFFPQFFR